MPRGDFVLGYFTLWQWVRGIVPRCSHLLCASIGRKGRDTSTDPRCHLGTGDREGEGTELLMLNQAGGALESPPSGHSAARRLGQVCWPHSFMAESSAGSGSSLPSE